MQFALVEGQRRQAERGLVGNCPDCGAEVLAKCGSRVVHHWAHRYVKQCDPWWENETAWHREWKNLFPEECREISHIAPDGEVHRSDVRTASGIFIEFQHSSMTDAERISRENFYQNLIWVIDGARFRKNFHVLHVLPDPASEIARDVVWIRGRREWYSGLKGFFWRPSENPGSSKLSAEGALEIHGMEEIREAVESAYGGHHQYDWVRPHQTWLESSCPVYVDLGDEGLVRLEKYDEYELPCVRRISRRKFLHDVNVEASAESVGTRFYRLPKPDYEG